MKKFYILSFVALFMFSTAEASQIFNCKDSSGRVVFQDSACLGSGSPLESRSFGKKELPRFSDCKLVGLPDSFSVFGVGKYDGISKAYIQLGSSGHEAKEIEVIVTSDERPIVLVLMAYDPVLWKVKRSPTSNILAVVVGGYHTQAVVGIEKKTPIQYFTYEEKTNCGHFYAYQANAQLTSASKRLKIITGRELDRIFTEVENKKIYVGSKRAPNYPLVYSSEYKVEDFVSTNQPPSGQKVIDILVRAGKLKLASKKDVDNWVDKASEKYVKYNSDLRVRPVLAYDKTYLVLEPFELPNGLFGAHSVFFIIPEGIPMPTGPRGHNSFYFMKDGSCKGPMCP